MEVTFTLTPEDLYHWNLYYRRHKYPIRPAFIFALLAVFGLVAAGVVFVLGISLLHHQPIRWTLLLFFPLVFFLGRKYVPPTRQQLTRFYAKNLEQFCRHTVTLDPTWVKEETPLSQNKMAWERLTSIEEDAHNLYLCVRGAGAHVIPKHAFTSLAQAQAFLDKARLYWDAAKTGQTVSDGAAEETGIWPPSPRPAAAN